MKNSEYNIVNITNEKNNFSAEYTKAQKVEFSFQPENKNPIKDELNDNSTVNDKVEDNLSKATKEKEKKKEKQESEALESSSSTSSSAATSGASTAASSSAASSTAAASSTGASGALGGIVAAATISVAAIGTIVGVNVMGPAQEAELATFLTSEVTPNSIDFSFSMPSRLLRYEEEGGQDAPIGEKIVVFEIANGSGFKREESLPEYEEYDEEHFIYYGYMGGLTPNTSYALTVSIKEYIPEYEEPIYNELGKRTFSTQAIPVTDDFKFETVEASATKVNFSFIVSNAALEYNPGTETLPVINATITSATGYEDTISIEQLTEYDETSMIGSGEFTGLTPSTTYTITISAELESGYKSFGYTSVTTENAVTFDTVEPTYSSVNFSFIVTNEAVEYNPSLASMPAIQATISDGNGFYDEMWLQQISTYDDSNLMGSGNFTGLSANTEYTITLYVSLEQELRTLGSTSFTTQSKPSSGFSFLGEVTPTEDSVSQRFYVSGDYIGYDASDPDACVEKLIPAVTGPTGAEISGSVSLMTTSGSTVVFMATVTGLTGNTSYVLNIYFDNNGTREQLNDEGKQFTTSEVTSDVSFNDDATAVGPEYIQFGFYLKTKYIQRSEAQGETITNVYAKVEDGKGFEAEVNITNISESSSNKSYCTGKFEELTPLTTYTISVYVTGEETITFSETLEVSTPASDSANFSYVTNSFKISCNTITFDFNISKSFLGFDPDDEEGKRTIMSNLFAEIDDNQHSTVRTTTLNLEVVSGDTLVGTASADGLISSNDAYVMNFYLFDSEYQMKTCISYEPYYFSTPGPEFRAPTIPTEVSFYSHQFNITLDFDDDSQNPQYDDLSLQFYDEPYDSENKYALGSSIALASITTEQTLLIPSNQDGDESYFEFDFDNIGSYVITANQAGVPTEVYHDDITFEDTDPQGEITGLNSDYLIAIDASTGDFTLPVQLLFTDDYHKFMSFYVELCPTDGVTPSISAGASREEDYQNLTYTGNDTSSVITYIQNGGTNGAEFDVKIYHFDDQSNPLWESDPNDPVYIKEADTNIVYGGRLYSTDLSEDSTSVQFGISYVAPVSTPTNPQIKFVDSSDPSLVYSYDFSFANYPSVDLTHPAMSTGSAISDYASLKAAFEGKTFTVIISYYDGTSQTTKTIQTGVSFTFA